MAPSVGTNDMILQLRRYRIGKFILALQALSLE